MTHVRTISMLMAALLALALAGGSAARTSVTKTIVVTGLGDAPDPKPADGVCKVVALAKGGPKSYCTLRAAIQTANFGPRGSYLIKLPAGTFHLAVPGKNEGKAAKGDLDVLQADVTLIGQGPAKTTIDGGGIDRVFDVSAFAGLTAKDLRITGGKAAGGGAISVSGTLTLVNVLVENSTAQYGGGGLYVGTTGGVDLKQTTFSHNVGKIGAGVFLDGHLTMTNVTVSGNNATSDGGALHVGAHAKASLLHVTIAGNTATNYSAISVGGPLANISLRSSIVTGTCLPPQPPADHFPFPQRNVFTSASCGDDPPVGDAGLLAPAVQGNVVPTVALAPTSPAIDFAFADTCPKLDARGVKRPQGAGCDSGAYELVKP
jgi:CSLREA domain-containing protein